MNLYFISQGDNIGCDTYQDAVVAAPDEATARTMHPENGDIYPLNWNSHSDWAKHPDNVEVKYIGKAERGTQQSVICASFNAG